MKLHDLKGARTLVTGGTGFIGRHLVSALAAAGTEISVVSRGDVPIPAAKRVCSGDLLEAAFVEKTVRETNPDFIFHLATYKERSTRIADFAPAIATNVLGSLNLFAAAADLKTLKSIVVMGTAEEYGSNSAPYDESMRERPVSAYSYSKQALTHLCEVLHFLHGLPTVVLRSTIAYGPGQSADMFLPALIESLLEDHPFPMTPGEQTRDFVYVSDVVDAALLAATTQGIGGEIINIGGGKAVAIADLARMVAAMLGKAHLLQLGTLAYRRGEVMSYGVETGHARTLLGWAPRVSLATGLAATIAHYRARA